MKQLEAAESMRIPELDAKYVPTGRVVVVKIEQFHTLHTRPDYAFLCIRAAAALEKILPGESPRMSRLVVKLSNLFRSESAEAYQTKASGTEMKNSRIDERKTKKGVRGFAKKSLPAGMQKKTVGRSGNISAGFDLLMSKSEDKDFPDKIKSFYLENFPPESGNETLGTRVAESITHAFSSGTVISSAAVKAHLEGIRNELHRRKIKRQWIYEINQQVMPVQEKIRQRAGFINHGRIDECNWLNDVRKDYFDI